MSLDSVKGGPAEAKRRRVNKGTTPVKAWGSMNKNIIIWTEGGKEVGMGHLRRCLVIAQELRENGIGVLFVINNDTSAIQWITHNGFKYKIAALKESGYHRINESEGGIILIDTKKSVANLMKRLKDAGKKIVLLDNFTKARLLSDIVIFPSAIFDNNLNWDGFRGRFFKGIEYIPIRETYINVRQKAKHLKLQPPYQILITMGGSDPNHLTGKVVSSLLNFQKPLNIKVVIGPSFSFDANLKELEKNKYANIEFIRNREDLSDIMANSHIGITALGATIYEFAAVGVPAVIIANFKGDNRDMKCYKRLGMNIPLGYHRDIVSSKIKATVMHLVSSRKDWNRIRNKGRMIIKVNGAKEISRIIKECLLI